MFLSINSLPERDFLISTYLVHMIGNWTSCRTKQRFLLFVFQIGTGPFTPSNTSLMSAIITTQLVPPLAYKETLNLLLPHFVVVQMFLKLPFNFPNFVTAFRMYSDDSKSR